MTARIPSEAEKLAGTARAQLSDIWTALPGIIDGYNPAAIPCPMASVRAGVYSDEDDSEGEAFNCPVRLPGGSLFGVEWAPQAGDHCTLIFHGLDPRAFWSLPTGPQRAELVRKHGPYADCWPAMYGPTSGVLDASALWVGNRAHTSGVRVTQAAVQLGNAAAFEAVPYGTTLQVWLTALYAWLNAHVHTAGVGPPVVPPPVLPIPLISLKVFVS